MEKSVILLENNEIQANTSNIKSLMEKKENEDLYFFDNTLAWIIVVTHEYIGDKQRRYCIYKEVCKEY